MSFNYLGVHELANFLIHNPKVGVEQWLGIRPYKGFRFIRWIRILQEERHDLGKWCLYEQESLDMGDDEFINIDEFQGVGDPDEPEGKRSVFDTLERALLYAATQGARNDRYVKVGELPYVYSEFFLVNGKPEKGIKEWFSS